MLEKPSDLQTLFMWSLVVKGGGAWKQDVAPDLPAPKRKQLVAAGLLLENWETRRDRKRPVRSLRLELSDAGWRHLEQNMSAGLATRSAAGAAVLGEVLIALERLMRRRGLTLAEAFDPEADGGEERDAEPPPPETDADALLERIRASRGRLAEPGGGITLAALRRELAPLGAERLDPALAALAKAGRIVLYPFDDPRRLTEPERKAALRLAGRDVHILYLP